jgi:WD40 repeat protein
MKRKNNKMPQKMKKLILLSVLGLIATIQIYAQQTYKFGPNPQKIFFHVQTVWAAEWSSDGKELFTCGGERQIAILNAETSELIGKTESLPFEYYPKGIITDSSNSIFAYYIFNGYENDVIKIHNTEDMAEIASIDGFETVAEIDLSKDGSTIYISGIKNNESVIESYNTKDGRLINTVAKDNGLWSFDISSDGQLLVAGIISPNYTGIYIYELETGKKINSISYPSEPNIIKFSPDEKQFTVGFYDKTAVIFNTETAKIIHTLEGYNGSVNALAYSPDGKHIVIAGMDTKQTFRVFNTETGMVEQSFDKSSSYINSLSYSPDGKKLAVTYTTWGDLSKIATIRIFNLSE